MDLFPIGKLGAPFGVRGEIKLHTYSGESAHLSGLDYVEARNAVSAVRLAVESVRTTATCALVKFKDIESPEVVKGYTHYELWVDRAFFCPKKANEYYIDELVGMALVDAKGEKRGVVLSVCSSGADDMLEVKTVAGQTCLVPFRKEFVGKVEVATRSVELLEDWIIE